MNTRRRRLETIQSAMNQLPFTSATQLTVLRMLFVPVFVLLLTYNHQGWALAVFIIAGITDVLDGLIARQFKQNTDLGALLDPIADKLLLTSAFIMLSFSTLDLTNRIPLWLTITTISRDVLLVVSCLLINVSTGYKDFPPTLYGKLTTFFQVLTVFVALVGNYLRSDVPYFEAVIYLTLAFTLVSGLHYVRRGLRIVSET